MDEHYEWELEDSNGEWVAGGSANDLGDVQQEGMRYLLIYSQDGPHKLIVRRHEVRTVMEICKPVIDDTSNHTSQEDYD